MTRPINCSHAIVEHTIAQLRTSGRLMREGVVLWLGKWGDTETDVVEAYEPPHQAAGDYFFLSSQDMQAMMAHLRATQTRICAQIHSHPGPAFHSKTDDEWSLVRREGALSLVVPRFARTVTPASFLDDIAAYTLSKLDKWEAVEADVLKKIVRIDRAHT